MKNILLSDAQRFFLRQLHDFHCLTEAQARHLLTVHGGAGERAVAPILRQLKSAGMIRRQDGVIFPDGGREKTAMSCLVIANYHVKVLIPAPFVWADNGEHPEV